jgi:hypothetical protein
MQLCHFIFLIQLRLLMAAVLSCGIHCCGSWRLQLSWPSHWPWWGKDYEKKNIIKFLAFFYFIDWWWVKFTFCSVNNRWYICCYRGFMRQPSLCLGTSSALNLEMSFLRMFGSSMEILWKLIRSIMSLRLCKANEKRRFWSSKELFRPDSRRTAHAHRWTGPLVDSCAHVWKLCIMENCTTLTIDWFAELQYIFLRRSYIFWSCLRLFNIIWKLDSICDWLQNYLATSTSKMKLTL